MRYHNLLVRYAMEASPGIVTGEVLGGPGELPAIWVYSAMSDRLRRTDSGWRIFERHVGATTMNDQLRPVTSDPVFVDPYLHRRAPHLHRAIAR